MVMIVLNNHEVFLGDDHILPIDLAKDIGLEHVGWRSCGKQTGFEQHEPVDMWPNHIDIVCDLENRQPQLLMQVGD